MKTFLRGTDILSPLGASGSTLACGGTYWPATSLNNKTLARTDIVSIIFSTNCFVLLKIYIMFNNVKRESPERFVAIGVSTWRYSRRLRCALGFSFLIFIITRNKPVTRESSSRSSPRGKLVGEFAWLRRASRLGSSLKALQSRNPFVDIKYFPHFFFILRYTYEDDFSEMSFGITIIVRGYNL